MKRLVSLVCVCALALGLAPATHAMAKSDKTLAAAVVVPSTFTGVRFEKTTVKVKYKTTTKKTKKLWKGESKVTVKGKNGKLTQLHEVTYENGKVVSKVLIEEKVKKAARNAVKLVGTKTKNGKGIDLRRIKAWEKIAKCESSGNWSINTGNGYYGGLQFDAASWRANGGTDFASLPHKATKAQQITVANRYADKRGFKPWGCKP
jgi:ribosomal protein L14E/L6E/L27E